MFAEHFKEKGLWNMIHRCKVIGAISRDWSSLDRQIARWNTRQNISMVDGNGEKVQSLIAVTFEGYDAGEVKFFTRN